LNLAQSIEQRLAALEPRAVELSDESGAHVGHAGARGGGSHFSLVIVADCFAGLNPMQRHRLVYQALGSLMEHHIHAIAIRAYTPDEL
jgi:BolA protein